MVDFGVSGNPGKSWLVGQMASRAKEILISWHLGTSLGTSWAAELLVSWHQFGYLGTSLADILASWHQLSCLAAFLVILGAKISIFWWLWHHANIAFV